MPTLVAGRGGKEKGKDFKKGDFPHEFRHQQGYEYNYTTPSRIAVPGNQREVGMKWLFSKEAQQQAGAGKLT